MPIVRSCGKIAAFRRLRLLLWLSRLPDFQRWRRRVAVRCFSRLRRHRSRSDAGFRLSVKSRMTARGFMGEIEVTSRRFNEGQTRPRVRGIADRHARSALVIPVFSTARYQSSWDVRLLDERGRVRERSDRAFVRARQVAADTHPASVRCRARPPACPPFRSMPGCGDGVSTRRGAASVRAFFLTIPSFWTAWTRFISTRKKRPTSPCRRVNAALLAWLNDGGHLIVGVESISDVNGTPWLKRLVPCDLTDMRTVQSHPELAILAAQPSMNHARSPSARNRDPPPLSTRLVAR